MNQIDLSHIFNTLANPTRLEIYRCILKEACECDLSKDEFAGNCVTAISKKLGINQPTVSNHIKELLHAGLIRMEKRGRKIYLFGTLDSADSLLKFSDFVHVKVNDAMKCQTHED